MVQLNILLFFDNHILFGLEVVVHFGAGPGLGVREVDGGRDLVEYPAPEIEPFEVVCGVGLKRGLCVDVVHLGGLRVKPGGRRA